MDKKWMVSPSPHLRLGKTTRSIMADVVIALLPAAVAATVTYGMNALWTMLICVVSCVVIEYVSRRIMKRTNTIGDLSAVVTGLLLAFNLPPGIHPLIAVFGCLVAIVVVKQMFGGLGQNFVNPAITARIVLMVSFPLAMSKYITPFHYQLGSDTMTSATPLALLQSGEAGAGIPSYLDLFLGVHSGCLGEGCALALLIGGVYLVIRRVITPIIPICFLGTVFLGSWVLGSDPLYQLLSGGLMLGAIFMATDYATSPLTAKGKIVFGIGCGLITLVIRLFGALPEGVSFAIILMNILTPHIERWTLPKPFGEERRRRESV